MRRISTARISQKTEVNLEGNIFTSCSTDAFDYISNLNATLETNDLWSQKLPFSGLKI